MTHNSLAGLTSIVVSVCNEAVNLECLLIGDGGTLEPARDRVRRTARRS